MFLTETDDVVDYIGSVIKVALRDAPRGARGAGRVDRLRLGLVDPDCVLLVDCATGEVSVGGRGEQGATGVVAMAGDTAVALCRGQVDLAAAVARGDIVVDGDGAVLIELFAERQLAAAG